MTDITPIVNAVVALVGVVITTILIPYVRGKITAAQAERTSQIIKTLVAAAEQIYGAGTGESKLAYVESMLGKYGIKVDAGNVSDTVRAQIEAAVLGLGNRKEDK